jgi:hypothetical protein
MAKITARLEVAKAALAEIDGKVATVRDRRRERLLAGDAASVIGKIDGELDALHHAARTETDRVQLLQAAAEEEAARQQAKEKAALIERIEKKFRERDAAAAELAAGLAQAAKALGKMVDTGSAIAAAWAWPGGYLHSLLLTTSSLSHAISSEMHRLGPEARLGGMDKGGTHARLPGAKAPSIDTINNPTSIKPLIALSQEASRLAGQVMRTGPPAGGQVAASFEGVPPALRADRQRTGTEAHLAQLLSRRLRLQTI